MCKSLETGKDGRIEEVLQKPQSMLSPQVKQVLLETIEKESKRATEKDDNAYLIDLQNARKLLQRGCWSIRKANPFLVHMEQCLLGKGGTLKDTQEAMRECSEKWRELPKETKRKLEVIAGKLAVYDYL